jgi:steroid 5-alpha reductase family enzyme
MVIPGSTAWRAEPPVFDLTAYLAGLAAMAAFGFAGWLISLYTHNVTLVDMMWGLFFLLGTTVYVYAAPEPGFRGLMLLFLVGVWALRLSIYLGWRNRGWHEDRRYRAIRANNQPNFWLKSLVIVFGLQALLAWIVSLPLLGVALSAKPLGWLDYPGLLLWALGLLFESIADWQLAKFKSNPDTQDAVLDRGLWRYSRHPNYFGEFCVWWGFYMIALSAGAWWSFPVPLLMTLLLLKVSGVALLEKDIAGRRPAYAEYIRRTPAFFPWKPKQVELDEAR